MERAAALLAGIDYAARQLASTGENAQFLAIRGAWLR